MADELVDPDLVVVLTVITLLIVFSLAIYKMCLKPANSSSNIGENLELTSIGSSLDNSEQ